MANHPNQTVILLLRLVLGGIFLVAGIGKLLDPAAFLEKLSHYEIPLDFSLTAMTWFLPSLECTAGILLLFNCWPKEACTILLGLTAIFTVALVNAWFRGLNIECGCFGMLGNWGSFPFWIARNFILAIGLFYLLTTVSRRQVT